MFNDLLQMNEVVNTSSVCQGDICLSEITISTFGGVASSSYVTFTKAFIQ